MQTNTPTLSSYYIYSSHGILNCTTSPSLTLSTVGPLCPQVCLLARSSTKLSVLDQFLCPPPTDSVLSLSASCTALHSSYVIVAGLPLLLLPGNRITACGGSRNSEGGLLRGCGSIQPRPAKIVGPHSPSREPAGMLGGRSMLWVDGGCLKLRAMLLIAAPCRCPSTDGDFD